jgi:hypothetical protein
MSELTDVELAAVARAKRRLASTTDPSGAYLALRVLQAATITQPVDDDPPIAAGLAMPAWTADTGAFLAVTRRPLLELLEERHAVA